MAIDGRAENGRRQEENLQGIIPRKLIPLGMHENR